MNRLSALVVASLFLAACASTTKPAETKPAEPVKQAAEPVKTDTASQAQVEAEKMAAALQALQSESIYFDFDKSGIKTEYRNTLQHHADWLKAHDKDTVTLEGNADERGSSEYNMALGNRRADSVHRALVAMGIDGSRIKDVSFGEEKPRASCHEEKCWSQNRRVDFVYKSE